MSTSRSRTRGLADSSLKAAQALVQLGKEAIPVLGCLVRVAGSTGSLDDARDQLDERRAASLAPLWD